MNFKDLAHYNRLGLRSGRKVSLRRTPKGIAFEAVFFQTASDQSYAYGEFGGTEFLDNYLYPDEEVKGWVRTEEGLESVKAMLEKRGFEVTPA